MKIALIGYGKMGKTIEHLIEQAGKDEVCLRVDSKSAPLRLEDLQVVDVAIEFSRPETVLQNINTCLQAKVPMVVGTTGWYDHFDAVQDLVAQEQGSLFFASNFSLGVNLFFQINKKLAAMMAKYPEYAVSIKEIHHTEKLDAPSGTAITLANQILPHYSNLSDWTLEQPAGERQLGIEALREPKVKGTHEIKYLSEIDEISIQHKAYSRLGFAQGALKAAHWLQGKQGIYTMEDLLEL